MLRPRIIPFLLISGSGLVKTRGFDEPKYVGDPINTVRLFNEKEVDELVVLDIRATTNGTEPDYATIENLAIECRMPLCYGGGIRSADSAASIVRMGVEKVALSAAALESPTLVARVADRIGSQSTAVVLDVRRRGDRHWSVWTHNGTRPVGTGLLPLIEELQAAGVGELVLNSIDRDGTSLGYDIPLAEAVRAACSVPITMVGGAGNLGHLEELVRACGVIGVGAGSLFVFKGVHRAVLVSYPDITRRDAIYAAAGCVSDVPSRSENPHESSSTRP